MTSPPEPVAPRPPVALAELDAGALARLRELDPDGRHGVIQRVLTAYETSLERMLGQLSGDGGADEAQVGAIAHTLKSSSASVGALALAAACADLERRLARHEPGDLRDEVERLRVHGASALLAVRAILRR